MIAAPVRVRTLHAEERPHASGDPSLPLVMEPAGPGALGPTLAHEWPAVRAGLDEHGAVLLRGFDCPDAVALERAFDLAQAAVPTLRPLHDYFLREPGRERLPGTRAVFATNTRFRTGGGLEFGGFHTENYYSLDIPSVQAFLCLRAPWVGGETALVRLRRGHAPLDEALWQRLEAEPLCTRVVALAEIARHYGVEEAAVERLLREAGLTLGERGPGLALVVQKPAVFRNPRTGVSTLQANLSLELPGLTEALIDRFLPRYAGPEWAAHRFAWRHPNPRLVLRYLSHLPRFARVPGLAGRQLRLTLAALRAPPGAQRAGRPSALAAAFTDADVAALADAIHQGASCFRWRPGDVLLVDSTQTLHAGMPGLGPRELAVMMFGPLPLPHPLASGLLDLGRCEGRDAASFDQRLAALAPRGGP